MFVYKVLPATGAARLSVQRSNSELWVSSKFNYVP